MAKKFKKDNKSRKDQQQKLQQADPEKLIDQGKAFLEKGKARDAIDVLKQAIKMHPDSDKVRHLLYKAYLLREEQLRSKGLIPEANAVRKMAIGVMPPVDQLSEADVLNMIACASVEDAVKLSVDFLKNRAPSARFDQQVAYRLMMTDDWQPLERLEASHPLRKDAQTVQNAVALMNDAKWEEAFLELKSVPRQSPYAPIKLFCRAMVLFYEKNDDELMQTLSRIPNDFPLKASIDSLKQVVGHPSAAESSALSRAQSIFWGEGGNPDTLVADILTHLKNREVKKLSSDISLMAKIVFPQNPVIAMQQILEILMFSPQRYGLNLSGFIGICQSLLPRNRADIVVLKTDLELPDDLVETLVNYKDVIDQDVSDAKIRDMVFGMILLYAAKKLHTKQFKQNVLKNVGKKNAKLVGIKEGAFGVGDAVFGMTVRSIELDPHNREAYDFLLELPRHARDQKDSVETLLLKMSAEFPDDPFPCLELATLYYEKNAFRKAEKILDDAAVRAPHDNRVIDRRALALVISAFTNMNRGRLHLVLSDLEKAEGYNSKRVALILAEKKILFDWISHPDRIPSILVDFCPEMSVIERIRVMGLLIQDMEDYRKSFTIVQIDAMKKWLSRELNRLNPTPTDVVSLLSPFPKEYQPILPPTQIAAYLLGLRRDLFGKVPDAELISIFELLFHQSLLEFMAVELQKRLKNKKQPQALPMEFFLKTISQIAHIPWSQKRYLDIVSELSEASRNELKGLSSRLSRHAQGFLRASLERFDFTLLEAPLPPFVFPGANLPDFMDDDIDEDDWDEDDWNDDDWDEDDWDDDMEDMDAAEDFEGLLPLLKEAKSNMNKKELARVVKDIERLVDEMDIRGVPDAEIRDMRNLLRSIPQTRKVFDALADFIKIPGLTGVSRETHILLNGKAPKK